MKILKSCTDSTNPTTRPLTFDTLKPGDVFRYGDHKQGPYLKLQEGFLDLSGIHFGTYTFVPTKDIKILDKAYLVTGEE